MYMITQGNFRGVPISGTLIIKDTMNIEDEEKGEKSSNIKKIEKAQMG